MKLKPQMMNSGTAPDSSWVTYSSVITRVNSGPLQQMDKSINDGLGRSHLSHTWLLQLFMALECDAWVGTLLSNPDINPNFGMFDWCNVAIT